VQQAAEPAIARFSYTTLCWSDLTGYRPTLDQVVERLKRYSLMDIVGVTSRLSVVLGALEKAGVDETVERQKRVASLLLGSAGTDALLKQVEAINGEPFEVSRTVLFHERQALNALKLAFLSNDLRAAPPRQSSLPLVEALLMLNDLIDPQEGEMAAGTRAGEQAMELYISANLLFNERPTPLRCT
jgi:hypothetical protein